MDGAGWGGGGAGGGCDNEVDNEHGIDMRHDAQEQGGGKEGQQNEDERACSCFQNAAFCGVFGLCIDTPRAPQTQPARAASKQTARDVEPSLNLLGAGGSGKVRFRSTGASATSWPLVSS